MMDVEQLLGSASEVRAIPLSGFSFELSFANETNYVSNKDDHVVFDYLARIAKRHMS